MVYESVRKIYGPYTAKDGRQRIRIQFDDLSFKVVSYPKYILEKYLDRYLSDDETVDHIDGNTKNNDPSNLQILSRKDNASKDVIKRKPVFGNCVWCGKEFELSKNQLNTRSKQKAGPFCSLICSGKYGADVRNSDNKLESKNVQVSYYKESGNPLTTSKANRGILTEETLHFCEHIVKEAMK